MIAYIGQVKEQMAGNSLLNIDIPQKSLRSLEVWIQRTARARDINRALWTGG